jgi:hypothetical protein
MTPPMYIILILVSGIALINLLMIAYLFGESTAELDAARRIKWLILPVPFWAAIIVWLCLYL